MKKLYLVFILAVCINLLGVHSLSDRVIPIKNNDEAIIAFGSCNDQRVNADPQIFRAIVKQNPDLWVWVGDVAYVRKNDKTSVKNIKEFNASKTSPSYTELRTKIPVIGVWDDHDFGANNGDKYYQYKEKTRTLYLDYLDEPQDSIRRTRPDGIYESYYIGESKKIKVILLDVRYNRDFRFSLNPKADILGEAQWEWFENELKDTNPDYFIVASGTQVMVDDRFYPEHWYTYSRNKLAETIRKLKRSGIVLLSGDVHYSEMMKYPCPQRIGYNLYEFTSSGLTHHMSGYNLPYGGELVNAIAPYTFNTPNERYLYENFGILRIKLTGEKRIIMETRNATGHVVLRKEIPFAELQFDQNKIDLDAKCVLDENPFIRIVTAYIVGMLKGDEILWGFTLVGGIAALVVLIVGFYSLRFIMKILRKRKETKVE